MRVDFQRLEWTNYPDTDTPINADNLNRIEEGVAGLYADLSDTMDDVEDLKTTVPQNTSEINTLKSRVDGIIALPDGSTTADAELVDIRTGAGGETYPSAGDAVRGQVGNLKQDLTNYIQKKMLDLHLAWHYLDANHRVILTDNIDVSDFTEIIVSKNSTGISTSVNLSITSYDYQNNVIDNAVTIGYGQYIGTLSRDISASGIDHIVLSVAYYVDPYINNIDTFANCVSVKVNYLNNKRTMYFANNGNDLCNGLSPCEAKKTPWDFIEAGNYNVLLKAGDVFYPNVRTHSDSYLNSKCLVIGNNTYIGSYGGSDRPIISGEIENNSAFTSYSGNIYSVYLDDKPPRVAFVLNDDGSINWKQKISLASLSGDGEYYYDSSTYTLYMHSLTDISGEALTYANGQTGLSIDHAVLTGNIHIDGICVKDFGFGISLRSKDSSVCNCEIVNIGGVSNGTTRLGNGIELGTRNNNVEVCKNIVHNIYDTCLTIQGNTPEADAWSNVVFEKNICFDCYSAMEVWNDGYSFKDVLFKNNYCYNMKDITDGYRPTGNTPSYLWNNAIPSGAEVVFEGNVGAGTDGYLSALNASDGSVIYENNTWLCKEGKVHTNPSAYLSETDVIFETNDTDYGIIGYVKAVGYDAIN